MSTDAQIIAAWISGICTVVASGIAAVAAALIGKRFADRAKLQADLDTATKDIQFLLAVEQRHCELHKNRSGESNFLRVRRHIESQNSLGWSGQFTPGRVRSARATAQQAVQVDSSASGGSAA